MGYYSDLLIAVEEFLEDRNPQVLNEMLSKMFHKNISVKVHCGDEDSRPSFVFCISPNMEDIDTVAKLIADAETKYEDITKVWSACESWRIDIDERILDLLSPSQFGALLVHEASHIIHGERVPYRLTNFVQYGVNTGSLAQKGILRNSYFGRILRIPIMACCESYADSSLVRRELKEKHDEKAFDVLTAVQILESAMDTGDYQRDIRDSTNYAKTVAHNLASKKEDRIKSSMQGLTKSLPDSLMKEEFEEIYKDWFDGEPYDNYMAESAQKISDKVYEEAFGFGKKNLAKIEQNQLDYVRVKIDTIHTASDKMMLISYVNNKIEMCKWYMTILTDPSLVRKYNVPHTVGQLKLIEADLNGLRERILQTPIPKNDRELYVRYPDEYAE